MKYYLIAGEASGDLHGSNLIKELKKKDTNSHFRFWGGDLMQAQGGELVKHYRDLAFMGFWEVLFNIVTILKNISFCKRDLVAFKPDALILIDYPGFNLRIAGYAHRIGLKVFYYISPQIWAWKQSRVNIIKQVVDKMFVILPFEKEFYKNFNFEVDFIGHPLLDALDDNKDGSSIAIDTLPNENTSNKIIALLPGSRKQEITVMLPVMLSITRFYPTYKFIIAGTSSIPVKVYQSLLLHSGNESGSNPVSIVYDQTYPLLRKANAALVTSGTATLETALHLVPEVVCYKGSRLSYLIAKKLIKTKYISLVNLIMDKEIVPELIQNDFNTINLRQKLDELLTVDHKRNAMINDFKLLKDKLGGRGASERASGLMLKYLEQ